MLALQTNDVTIRYPVADSLIRLDCSKNFIFPVYRDNGYMMILSQFQETCFLLTFLEDYRKNPAAANPWMSVTLYDEFMADKGMGLLRGDVSAQLTKNVRSSILLGVNRLCLHADLISDN